MLKLVVPHEGTQELADEGEVIDVPYDTTRQAEVVWCEREPTGHITVTLRYSPRPAAVQPMR